MALYLTPAALSYLTQLILAVLISGYLFWRARQPGQPRHLLLLAGFFTAIASFVASLFLEAALLPTPRLYAVFIQNTLLGLALIALLQFAYHFPALSPSLRREARLALILSSLYTLWEGSYAIFRFAQLSMGHVEYRPWWSDYALLLLFLWAPLAFLHQTYTLTADDSRSRAWRIVSLLRPIGREARAARTFALIFLFVAGLSVFNILRANYLMTVALANLSISIGIVIALFVFAVTYLNNQSETTSFIIRITGIALTTMLAIMGAAAWIISPVYEAHYQPRLPDRRTLHFTPNTLGGYDVTDVPFTFETPPGINLQLSDSSPPMMCDSVLGIPIACREEPGSGKHDVCSPALDFAFPFYGRSYSQAYACNDGTMSFDRAVAYRNYQYRYGAGTPLIMPLLIDLYPEISPGGAFVRQEPDRLIVTWDHMRGFRLPDAEFTFQLVLYHSGVFDITYNGLPAELTFHPNDDPGASVWAVGAVPGSLTRDPQIVALDALPLRTGPDGMIQDFLLEFRQHLRDLFAPLAGLILAASGFIVIIFPLAFYVSLVNPLNALLHGVRRVEAGDDTAPVPVQFADEIGYLTQAFNTLATQLSDLIRNLSAKVVDRTAELAEAKSFAEERSQAAETANTQLSAHLRELEARNEELDAFAHTVAHDIRGPVSQIVSYAQLLAEYDDQLSLEDRARSLRSLIRSGNKLTNIINELLLLAGLRKVDVQLEPLSMGVIVAEAQQRLTDLIEKSGAEIIAPPMEAWPIALGHPAWVEEVWANYISNACKYGGSPPRITLGADLLLRPSTGEGRGEGFIRFWVRDTGHGITLQDQARLFTPFTRLDQVRARGHGLGLSIVRRIVEKLGGEVGIESDGVPGHGSVFSFTLPAAPEGTQLPAAPADLETWPADDRSALVGLSVLIVDDEALFADGMRNLLMARGLKVLGMAHDGLEAQDIVRTLNPQIILMDIDMPRVNGLEAARAIKAERPEIKIVMLTASEREDHLFEAIRNGASGYLLKGAKPDAFCAQLAGLTRGEVPLSHGLATRLMAEFAHSSPQVPLASNRGEVRGELTEHQWGILQRVAQGMTYKEIGAALYLTEQTVKYHMGQILDKLYLQNRAQAIAYFQHVKDKPPKT